jgi:transcriptional regulator with XRE-family HTH domain
MGRGTKPRFADARDVDVGQRIRAQRLVCRMSQAKLANRLGVATYQVQKYESGLNRVSAGRLARIAEALNVPVSFFFSGDDTRSETGENVNLVLRFLETAGAVRLTRAYSEIGDARIRHLLVLLVERIVGAQRSRKHVKK